MTLKEFVAQEGSVVSAARKLGVPIKSVRDRLTNKTRKYTKIDSLFAAAGIEGFAVVPPGHKRCSKCGCIKRNKQFHKKSQSRDGIESWCKLCKLKDNKKSYFKHEKTRKRQHDSYNKTPQGKYVNAKCQARDRGISFELTFEEYWSLRSQSCFVTGCTREVTGLDRIDNNQDYLVHNVRPCCRAHNTLKNTLTDSEAYLLAREYVNWYEQQVDRVG